MINFRYHLVSLIAVFLALAVGIVIGATVVQRAIVDGLNNRIEHVSKKADATQKENDQLRAQVAGQLAFIDQIDQLVVANRLNRVPVVVVALQGVDPGAVKAEVQLLQTGGGMAPGILWVEDPWALKDGDADKLAAALGLLPRADHNALRDEAWMALATRLATGRASAAGDPITTLVDAKFLRFEAVGNQPAADLASFPGAGARVLLVGGEQSDVDAGPMLVSATRALVAAQLPTVVGEVYAQKAQRGAGPDRGATLAATRADPTLASAASTVDDLDLAEGRVTAALALAALGQQPPVVGQYGKDRKLPTVTTP